MKNHFSYSLPTLVQCWVIIAVFVFIGTLLSVGVAFLIKLMGLNPMPLTLLYIIPMVPAVAYIWWLGYISKRYFKEEPVAINSPRFGGFKGVGKIILFFVILCISVICIGLSLDPLNIVIKMPEAVKLLFTSVKTDFWDMFISTSICAPLLEELIFRGIIQRGLAFHYKKKGVKRGALYAILWSAFFFALIHFNLWQAIPAFVLGLFFGWIYLKTKCLWATIFMHFIMNTTSIISATFSLEPTTSLIEIIKSSTGSSSAYWAIIAGAAVMSIICIMLLHKCLRASLSKEINCSSGCGTFNQLSIN